MRRHQFSAEAQASLDHQIDYLLARNPKAAAELNDRVHGFVRDTLCNHPRVSRHITERDVWETWIPETRLVLWYVFDAETVTVVAVWHTAQNRPS